MRGLVIGATVLAMVTAPLASAQDAPGAAFRLPVKSCLSTRIKELGSRLEGAPDSGSFVSYTSGDSGVSYDEEPAIQGAKVGDQVKLCVLSTEHHCPTDSIPVQVLSARDLRTGAAWKLSTGEHGCRSQ